MNLIRSNVVSSAGYVPGEQPTDTKTIKLNTNENPYEPGPAVMNAIRNVTPEQLRRYPNPSARPFREAAAKVHSVSPDQILTFNGGDEFLATAIRSCASEKDAVAYLEPSYSLYPVLAEMQGARKIALQYDIQDQVWHLPAGIEKTDAKILLIVNPNAPSGTRETPARLAQIVAAFKGVVLIDEAYVDFAPESCLPLVKEFPNVILLRTLSKGYSLAGLRFGYAIGPAPLLKEMEKMRDSYPCDAVSIAAATAAISDQNYARATWEKVKSERARLSDILRAMGFKMPESASNFVLAQVPAGVNAQHVYEFLKSRGILVRYFNLPRLTDKLRITIGTPEQNDWLLRELKEILKK